MKRVCFDYGHGGRDPGACYKGRREAQEVLKLGVEVAKRVRAHGIIVDETRKANETVSLWQRCQVERQKTYDYFISFHRNAYKPEMASGAETYTYLKGGPKAQALASRIQAALVAVGYRNRGVKQADFYVLRQTKAPAVLVEIGFIDHSGDNCLFDHQRQAIIKGLTQAIVTSLM